MTKCAFDPHVDPDPKGLIREAYRISGISAPECRSIFLDWTLSMPEGLEPAIALQDLLLRHGAQAPDHPMTEILSAGLATSPVRRRRGGRTARQEAGQAG